MSNDIDYSYNSMIKNCTSFYVKSKACDIWKHIGKLTFLN